jgi:exodeoxyribonuclease V alpha subunit
MKRNAADGLCYEAVIISGPPAWWHPCREKGESGVVVGDLFQKADDDKSLIELEGQIEGITFSSEDTGFMVARVRVTGYRDLVTVVGNLPAPRPGEMLKMQGLWMDHPKFGRQFKILSHKAVAPATLGGIRKYLGSGLIKGIGPVTAARIVEQFGEKTLDVIEHRIHELGKVEGLGLKRIEMIEKAWKEQREIRGLMIFLQGHDVSPVYAAKIFRHYGGDAVRVVTQNPYRLATDIFGIGFLTADRIAHKMGFEKNAPSRAEAGILHVLRQISEEGHVYYPYEPLVEKCKEILDVEREVITMAVGALAFEGKLVIEDLTRDLNAFQPNQKAVYLRPFHVAESGIAGFMKALISTRKNIGAADAQRLLESTKKSLPFKLAPKQEEAVRAAVEEKVVVITGGPGTGKTTIINLVIRVYREKMARVLLAAPTGRAAKRMSEATGFPSRTLHRLLEYAPRKGGFMRNQDNPLEVDVLAVDEASMVDTVLMYHLLKALPAEATLILVGDVYQLPSVGAGNVLKDLILSGVIPVVELKEIFRQAAESRITVNAHRINAGLLPEWKTGGGALEDFYFIKQDDPEQALRIIMDLVRDRISRRFRFDRVEDIQVLSPMHKGVVGTENLNVKLQEALNPSGDEMARGERKFRLGDKVMQVRNNYEKEVFNGDIGRITSIDNEEQVLTVAFDGVPVPYEASELDEIVHAYAISVHKSQGSEYPAVIVPILSQHHVLLQRNLIYTAVTRAKKLAIMVGSKKALAMGVRNDTIMRRHTYLAERMRSAKAAFTKLPEALPARS